MYQIDKTINFCYGHRVWTQELNEDYCADGDNQTKCKHPHGHEGSVRVFLESDTLNNGFVTDFKHLGWLKDFINAYIDHKFVLDINDPAFPLLTGATKFHQTSDGQYFLSMNNNLSIGCEPVIVDKEPVAWRVMSTWNIEPVQQEILEGFLFIDFVPTSENLAKWLYDIVDEKMKQIDVVTSHIEWWETPKSRSVYFGNK